MPTEFRFDDLDLREEPARGESHVDDTGRRDRPDRHLTATQRCTRICCV